MSDAATDLVVTARPRRTGGIAIAASVVIAVVFGVTAVVMRHADAGAHFGIRDQIGTAVVGLILAGTALLPTRPRLEADTQEVRTRAYLGGYRRVPWTLVVGVEFPDRLRFARLVLPGDETVALYAVQRYDRDRAVAVMRGLRALFAQSRRER
ncbi:MAG: PH domain-containing protein [Actinomycetota bacterium]